MSPDDTCSPPYVVLAEGLSFPEGPAFDPSGTLWCVEMTAGALWSRTVHGEIRRRFVGGRPNGIAIDAGGHVWFCDSGLNAIRRLDPITDAVSTIVAAVDGAPLKKPNDLAFDGLGNLVFTCPGDSRTEATGSVCCRAPDGGVAVIASGLYFPNGLAFTADRRSLLIAETYRQRVWKGRWDGVARTWSDPHAWATTAGPIGPDGIAVAASGVAFIAVHGTDRIEMKSVDGSDAGALTIDNGNPTNCAFDPNGSLGLVVTETTHGRVLSYPGLGPGCPIPTPAFSQLIPC